MIGEPVFVQDIVDKNSPLSFLQLSFVFEGTLISFRQNIPSDNIEEVVKAHRLLMEEVSAYASNR